MLDVLIVGAGPVGLTASLLLARLGIAHEVVERRGGLHEAPQAHVLKTRTMEIYRGLGLDEAIHAGATPREQLRYINWFTQLTHRSLGALDMAKYRGMETVAKLSATRAANFPQDDLEAVLLKGVCGGGGTVRFNRECIEVRQTEDSVVVFLKDTASGEVEQVRARYILAADGAGSSVRRQVGIPMIGPAAIGHFVAIYFHADLRPFMATRPGNVNWCLDPDSTGTLIVHEMARRSVFMYPFDPEARAFETFTVEACAEIVRLAIGISDYPVEIRDVGRWTMTAQVAETYRAGNVILVGDAAHRFPPTGGLGLNTGVQDIYNLVWKLRLVLNGVAGDGLLGSYATECRPIALANSEQSLTNQLRNAEVTDAIGITEDRAETLRNLGLLLAEGNDGERRREALGSVIEGQLPHYQTLGLDMGFSYELGATIPDGTPRDWRGTTQYVPSTRPGARTPHCWLRCDGKAVAMHDLLVYDAFTLICGPGDDGWAEAAQAATREFGVQVQLLAIGEGCAVEDPDGEWAAVRGIPEEGALLVRPDGHVAWRAAARPPAPDAALAGAMRRLLFL